MLTPRVRGQKNPLEEAPVICCCCCWWLLQIQSCPANASPSPGSAPHTLPARFSGSAAPNKGPKAATWKNNQAVLLNHQSAHPKEKQTLERISLFSFPSFSFQHRLSLLPFPNLRCCGCLCPALAGARQG